MALDIAQDEGEAENDRESEDQRYNMVCLRNVHGICRDGLVVVIRSD